MDVNNDPASKTEQSLPPTETETSQTSSPSPANNDNNEKNNENTQEPAAQTSPTRPTSTQKKIDFWVTHDEYQARQKQLASSGNDLNTQLARRKRKVR
ncbi:hypothetical protein EJ05DRAFT_480089 [Pseudovirgaria hyperparasitica]|uniref:Uncharacterized protein n=1 Tax=Pseudovirgaria hyperparasitica TaxID=470096 RepID=A0A6A6VWH0_9PEZI|nr:uncharacterized protein EJ05DRAFT_480089 [Pseudovirgaria hyperparasitica]KAF2753597.1 hypothetical protein EJ05DRAFT_480089 [Pseudovirgaria hyperparasitica]